MHRYRTTSRALAFAALVLSVVLAGSGLGAAPASAAAPPAAAAVSPTADTTAETTPLPACAPGETPSAEGRCTVVVPQVSEGGCGFLQRCVYFNRTEQTYLITGGKWLVQAALCAGSLGIGCALAGLLVELGAQYLLSRGGLCPTSKPRLRVQWFPTPQAEGCVA